MGSGAVLLFDAVSSPHMVNFWFLSTSDLVASTGFGAHGSSRHISVASVTVLIHCVCECECVGKQSLERVGLGTAEVTLLWM